MERKSSHISTSIGSGRLPKRGCVELLICTSLAKTRMGLWLSNYSESVPYAMSLQSMHSCECVSMRITTGMATDLAVLLGAFHN